MAKSYQIQCPKGNSFIYVLILHFQLLNTGRQIILLLRVESCWARRFESAAWFHSKSLHLSGT